MSQTTSTTALTVVLVHGAFADSSSWAGVIERLQATGVPVIAAANPLRGISTDSAYVASVFDQVPGPVLAVAHSYGGAVITNAAVGASARLAHAAAKPDEDVAATWNAQPRGRRAVAVPLPTPRSWSEPRS